MTILLGRGGNTYQFLPTFILPPQKTLKFFLFLSATSPLKKKQKRLERLMNNAYILQADVNFVPRV